MKPLFQQTIILLCVFFLFFIWKASGTDTWTIPLISILTAGYLITLHLPALSSKQQEAFAVFFITLTVLLIVSFTGGTTSVFFFLLFFLLFYLAFVFSPGLVFLFTLLTLCTFFLESGTSFESQMTLASLGFFSPLAYFFGKALQTKTKIKESLKQIQNEASEIRETTGATLKKEDLSRLDDIIRKSKDLEHEE